MAKQASSGIARMRMTKTQQHLKVSETAFKVNHGQGWKLGNKEDQFVQKKIKYGWDRGKVANVSCQDKDKNLVSSVNSLLLWYEGMRVARHSSIRNFMMRVAVYGQFC